MEMYFSLSRSFRNTQMSSVMHRRGWLAVISSASRTLPTAGVGYDLSYPLGYSCKFFLGVKIFLETVVGHLSSIVGVLAVLARLRSQVSSLQLSSRCRLHGLLAASISASSVSDTELSSEDFVRLVQHRARLLVIDGCCDGVKNGCLSTWLALGLCEAIGRSR